MRFENKVRSMSAKEIIMAMVDGLKNPTTDKVDMETFGDTYYGVCYGCAATNTISKIAGTTTQQIRDVYQDSDGCNMALEVSSSVEFFQAFEESIDYLRRGYIDRYNRIASKWGYAIITNDRDLAIPYMFTKNYKDCLPAFVKLAESQHDPT